MKAEANKIIELMKREVESFVDFDNLKMDVSLEDQGLDSLDLISTFLAITEEYGIKISDDEMDSLTTVNEIVSFINNQ